MRTAILERDASQVGLLSRWLESGGHGVCAFGRWSDLAGAFEHQTFDALVLDCNAADESGIQLLEQLRDHLPPSIPVLVCSARNEDGDVAAALRAGAHDYIVKPVHRALLLARLAAIARRHTQDPESAQIEVAEFRIDYRERLLLRNNVRVQLAAKDFELAALFLRNVGRLLSRDHIHDVVWKARPGIGSRAVDTRVSRIRIKLKLVPEHGWRLAAVYGHGYRLLRGDIPAQAVEAAPTAATGETRAPVSAYCGPAA